MKQTTYNRHHRARQVARFLALLMAVIMVLGSFALLLAGCSTAGGGKKAGSVDLAKLRDDLLADISFESEMTPLDDSLFDRYYSFDPSLAVEKYVVVSNGWTVEEIALFQAADEDKAKTIEAAMQERVEDQKKAFEDYVPAELTKLQSPVIVRSGVYVGMCISGDDSKAQEIMDQYLK
ncbi:MAG: DUF4358 domain-containing protein [Oscillospiraceae bacterium]|nr:DUF4358 domain-containing protein [Oscillospiraceae bacterium]MDD4369208.1 DUF4358 domain-containing protein [Oscillospiraceae bacterium]